MFFVNHESLLNWCWHSPVEHHLDWFEPVWIFFKSLGFGLLCQTARTQHTADVMHDCGMRFLKTYKAICWSYIRPVGEYMWIQYMPRSLNTNMFSWYFQVVQETIRNYSKISRNPTAKNGCSWRCFLGFPTYSVLFKVMAHICIDIKRFSALIEPACVRMCVCVCICALIPVEHVHSCSGFEMLFLWL